jgi:hypothetical protein
MRTSKTTSLGLALCLITTGAFGAGTTKPAPRKVAFLGVSAMPVDETLRHHLKLPRGAGLTVQEVTAESPASEAGVKAHDVLERLNDQILFNTSQFRALVRSFDPGQTVTVKLWREGESKSIEAKLKETEVNEPEGAEGANLTLEPGSKGALGLGGPGREVQVWRFDTEGGGGPALVQIERALKAAPGSSGPAGGKPGGYLGVHLRSIDPSLAAQLGLKAEEGAMVAEVMDGSPAAAAGVREHDVVLELDGSHVDGPEALARAIRKHKKGDAVVLRLLRSGKKTEAKVTLDERKLPEAEAIDTLFEHIERETDKSASGAQKRLQRLIIRSPEAGAAAGPPTTKQVQQSTIVIRSDDGGTTRVETRDGHSRVRIEGPDGKVTFDGPADTQAEREKLPADVIKHLDRIEKFPPVPPSKPVEPMHLKVLPGPGMKFIGTPAATGSESTGLDAEPADWISL